MPVRIEKASRLVPRFVKGIWEASNGAFRLKKEKELIVVCIMHINAYNHYVVYFMQRSFFFLSQFFSFFFRWKRSAFFILLRKETWTSWIHQVFKPSPGSHWPGVVHDLPWHLSFSYDYKIHHFTPFATFLTYKSWSNLYSNYYYF